MTLCGFIKGKGQSFCHSVCKNREERRGSNRTPGKLQPKWGVKLRALGCWGNSSKAGKQKTERHPDFEPMVYSTLKLDVEKGAGIRSEILCSRVLSFTIHLFGVFTNDTHLLPGSWWSPQLFLTSDNDGEIAIQHPIER